MAATDGQHATAAAGPSDSSSGNNASGSGTSTAGTAATRLDRLVSLLETGTTAAVKQTAAQQLGQIAALRVRGTYNTAIAASAISSNGKGKGAAKGTVDEKPLVIKQDATAATASTSNVKLEDTVNHPIESSSSTESGLAAAGAGGKSYVGPEGEWPEAIYLLAKIVPHLRSKSWDTRTAAAMAVGVVCEAAGRWDIREPGPSPSSTTSAVASTIKIEIKSEETPTKAETTTLSPIDPTNPHWQQQQQQQQLTFSHFSLSHLLATGTRLLASAGKEYTIGNHGGGVQERLAAARDNLRSLGLLGAGASGETEGGAGGGANGGVMDFDMEEELRAGEEDTIAREKAEEAKQQQQAQGRPGLRVESILAPPAPLPPPRFSGVGEKIELKSVITKNGNKLSPPTPMIAIASPDTGAAAAASTPPVVTASPPPPTPAEEETIDWSKLSAWERNQLKRKRKMESKTSPGGGGPEKSRIVESMTPTPSPVPPPATANGKKATADEKADANVKIRSPSAFVKPLAAGESASSNISPTASSSTSAQPPPAAVPSTVATAASANGKESSSVLLAPPGEWPFAIVTQVIAADLFHTSWEVRHGAALGLREIVQKQGRAGGMKLSPLGSSSTTSEVDEANESLHRAWAQDLAIKLLSVLSLDRLGDFIFDHVVAPVRETASQTLAALMRVMDSECMQATHRVLVQMIAQDHLQQQGDDEVKMQIDGDDDEKNKKFKVGRGTKGYSWEVRHAGLLGLKYELALRHSRDTNSNAAIGNEETLTENVQMATLALRDDDDDIRTVAASMLIPVADEIVDRLASQLPMVARQLWECLEHAKDDLSSSVGSVMNLLATLMQNKVVVALVVNGTNARPLAQLVPMIYPFFRHTIASVRAAAVRAVATFLSLEGDENKNWIDDRIFRLLFQNMVVEEKVDIRTHSAQAWATLVETVRKPATETLAPHIGRFFSILMTPLGQQFEASLFYRPTSHLTNGNGGHDVDKSMLAQDLILVGMDSIVRGRLGAAMALGEVLAEWPVDRLEADFAPLLHAYLDSSSALQRCLAAAVLQEWADAAQRVRRESIVERVPLAKELNQKMIATLEAPAPDTYAEMTTLLMRCQTECQALCNMFVRDGKLARNLVPTLPTQVDSTGQDLAAFRIQTAKEIAGPHYKDLAAKISTRSKKTAMPLLEQKQWTVVASIGFYETAKAKQDTQMFASIAAAVIALGALPDKLNPIIRSIMNSVKFEENRDMQERSAQAVAQLIEVCCVPGAKSNPSAKVVKNLCAFVCQDTSVTPVFEAVSETLDGILTVKNGATASGEEHSKPSEETSEGALIRRGAQIALAAIAKRFGARLFTEVPAIWDGVAATLLTTTKAGPDNIDTALAQNLLDSMNVLQIVLPTLSSSLHYVVADLLPHLTIVLQSKYAVLRSVAAQTIAAMAKHITPTTMLHIVNDVIPLVDDAAHVRRRQGAVEAVALTVRALDIDLLPYLVFLVIPLLGRMGDSNEEVRMLATSTFGVLVKMVPLESGLPDPVGFPEHLMEKRQEQRQFLEQLLGNNKVQPYHIPVPMQIKLRKYQQDGVSWMAFLAKYQLHGVLCDDMGLGKTLQSITILASKHFERNQSGATHLPSLVVCPPTLTGHWVHEIRKYATNLVPMNLTGTPAERAELIGRIDKFDVIVTSYEILRNHVAQLSDRAFNYCILDEGHVIKNPKSKISKAVKAVKANHRLLLSGTPIQNSVLELWSLFDFLMPGFLGSEKSFNDRFSKPILATRDGKSTAKEREAAALALEALHKQVLPFVLRRLKEDVLDDLPPKIIQDIECDLGTVQRELYDEYQKSQRLTEGALNKDGEEKQHVFQTLQYLRKLVNHPKLVMDRSNPKHVALKQRLAKTADPLESIVHAPKLQALRQLLDDCGIGQQSGSDSAASVDVMESAVSQHRVLVFCQSKDMLDIIERDLFRKLMPLVTYTRLDGSVAAEKRFDIVQTFNADPSIDVLLLTTAVGGLGLTLTGADTVIFVEHDWNPMKDLQAMDRAHRLGQRKVVNVYRLITKNTLEAKIMGLQRFKLNMANSVVNQQNADSLEAMDSNQVLDLFDVDAPSDTKGDAASKKKETKFSEKAVLDALQNMPDTEEIEYANMTNWDG